MSLLEFLGQAALGGGVAFWLLKAWLPQRIKYEFAVALASHRSELEGLRNRVQELASIASTALSTAQRVSLERKLQAIEKQWEAVSELRSLWHNLQLLDITPKDMISRLFEDPEFRSYVRDRPLHEILAAANAAIQKADAQRPFAGEVLHSLVAAYAAILVLTWIHVDRKMDNRSTPAWSDDPSFRKLISSVLDIAQIEEFDRLPTNRMQFLRERIEERILQHCETVLSGKAAAEFSVDTIQGIQRTANAVWSSKEVAEKSGAHLA